MQSNIAGGHQNSLGTEVSQSPAQDTLLKPSVDARRHSNVVEQTKIGMAFTFEELVTMYNTGNGTEGSVTIVSCAYSMKPHDKLPEISLLSVTASGQSINPCCSL